MNIIKLQTLTHKSFIIKFCSVCRFLVVFFKFIFFLVFIFFLYVEIIFIDGICFQIRCACVTCTISVNFKAIYRFENYYSSCIFFCFGIKFHLNFSVQSLFFPNLFSLSLSFSFFYRFCFQFSSSFFSFLF